MQIGHNALVPAPHALIIEDYRPDALNTAAHLRQAGFQVKLARSLSQSVEEAQAMVAGAQPGRRILIVVDLHLPLPRTPGSYTLDDQAMTEGAAFAAYFGPDLRCHALVVASTSDPSEESRQEALLAGCRMVFLKPFTHYQASILRALVEMPFEPADQLHGIGIEAGPAPTAQLERRRGGLWNSFQQVLGRAARRIVELATISEETAANEQGRWDDAMVRDLLLNYPDLLRQHPAADRWIEHHGGLEAVLDRIQKQAARYPRIHQRILESILDNPDASDWENMLRQVGLAKNAFYKHRKKLFQAIATEMNSWE